MKSPQLGNKNGGIANISFLVERRDCYHTFSEETEEQTFLAGHLNFSNFH